MNATITMTILATLFVSSACAQEPVVCQTSLRIADVTDAMGAGVAIQPVFSVGGVKGWRVYNVHRSAQLTALKIAPGALMTHVCGVAVREISAQGGDICCNVDATREFEVTFLIADQETKVMIKRST